MKAKNTGTKLYDRVKELLKYDPETGLLTWKIDKGRRIKKGDIAGCLNKTTGYIVIRIDEKLYQAHRIAYLLYHGFLPENSLDHINRDKTDNRIENLREASVSCNLRNSTISKNNTSGVVGVSWNKRDKRWKAQIMGLNGKEIYLGYFANLDDAVKARYAAEIKYDYDKCNSCTSAKQYLTEKGLI